MLKRLILIIITVLFSSSCSPATKYIEISGKEFKEELMSLSKYNTDTKFYSWEYLTSGFNLEEDKYLYFRLTYFYKGQNDSVINIHKRLKVNKKEIKIHFDSNSFMQTRDILSENVTVL